jgi:hypothetical protein
MTHRSSLIASFMSLYAYCLSDELRGEMLEDVAGVCGMRPRLMECGGVSAAVSDFEEERISVEREHVFAHERVIQRVLAHVTPLPFRFGTIVTARGLEEYIEANRAQLIKSMERVRGSVEMSVKIIWDAEKMRGAALRPDAERGESIYAEPQTAGKGAAYLAARRREILGDELLKERAEELAAWLTAVVGETAVESDTQTRPSESLVIRAGFLVRRERLREYQACVERARAERGGLRFLTSGPWPPYSFSNIKT